MGFERLKNVPTQKRLHSQLCVNAFEPVVYYMLRLFEDQKSSGVFSVMKWTCWHPRSHTKLRQKNPLQERPFSCFSDTRRLQIRCRGLLWKAWRWYESHGCSKRRAGKSGFTDNCSRLTRRKFIPLHANQSGAGSLSFFSPQFHSCVASSKLHLLCILFWCFHWEPVHFFLLLN